MKNDKLAIYRLFCIVLIIILAVLFITGAFLYFNGFRVVYDIQLEKSWPAISGVASWASVLVAAISAVLSFIAIYVAIRVPVKIANRQDKVAIFEKKLDCYIAVLKITGFSDVIKEADTKQSILQSYQAILKSYDYDWNSVTCSNLMCDSTILQQLLISGSFVFSAYNVKEIQRVLNSGIALIERLIKKRDSNKQNAQLTSSEIKLLNTFCTSSDTFKNKYLESMEKELDLH